VPSGYQAAARNPPFSNAGSSIMHAPNNKEATLLQLCTPLFMGNTKENPIFGTKKVPFSYAPPGRRSDVPSIMQVQSYLGGLGHSGVEYARRFSISVMCERNDNSIFRFDMNIQFSCSYII